jgi:hypothetical protein
MFNHSPALAGLFDAVCLLSFLLSVLANYRISHSKKGE